MNTKRLLVRLNQISSQYLGKIMYALFFMSILESLSAFVILSPVLTASASDFYIKAATILLSFVVLCVWLTFQFGFSVMLLRMARRHYANLGFIFIGFKRFNPAFKVILSFAAIFAILVIVARFLARLIFSQIKPCFSFQNVSLQNFQDATANSELIHDFALNSFIFLGIFLAILFVISVFALIRFVFVFQLHFDNPNDSVPALFSKSFRMMKKNSLRLVIFALQAGGKYLLIAISIALIANVLPTEKDSALSVLIFLLDIAYFINFYTAITRIYLTVPILYEEVTNPRLPLTEYTETTESV